MPQLAISLKVLVFIKVESNKQTIVINKVCQHVFKKCCVFKRGLETSRNVGYLDYYFLTM